MDTFEDFDYALAIVCVLTGFCKFIPSSKSITAEKVFKLVGRIWIFASGRPTKVTSDNDARVSQDHCFYRIRKNGYTNKFCNPLTITMKRS